MDLPIFVIWVIVIGSLAWAVFSIAVMVSVWMVAREALPYFERMNAQHRQEELSKWQKSRKHVA